MNMPGNQWIPPQHQPPGQFPTQQYPGGRPAPRPPRNTGPLIISGALIIAAAIVATALFISRQGHAGTTTAAPSTATQTTETSSAAPSSTTMTTSAATGPTYQVVPQSTLPTTADVSRLTGITMSNAAAPLLAPGTDANATPPSCMFAADSATQSTWKAARAMAGQRHIEGTFENYNSSAAVGLAVFASPADAASSLTTVSGSVRGCTTFTVPDWNPKNPPATWTVGDVERADDHITWNTTATNGWSCRRNYRIVGNLAASAVVCSDKPTAHSPTALTDFVIANATKQ